MGDLERFEEEDRKILLWAQVKIWPKYTRRLLKLNLNYHNSEEFYSFVDKRITVGKNYSW